MAGRSMACAGASNNTRSLIGSPCFAVASSTGPPADWWSRPEYVCYNLNIGSVVAAPAHDEVVRLPPSGRGGGGGGGDGQQGGEAEATYTLRGFAHTGALSQCAVVGPQIWGCDLRGMSQGKALGRSAPAQLLPPPPTRPPTHPCPAGAGHLVIRAELSLDGGDTWHHTRIAEREPGVRLGARCAAPARCAC